jgi:glycosyltransferase involved in cell wall biosynthesis
MRVCKIWDADYPWDIRVEKVVDSLQAAGHSVDLVCRNQARRPRIERDGAFTIHRLPSLPLALGPLHAVANFPHPLSPVWLRSIADVVRRSRSDLILVRDIPLALPAIAVGRRRRIPVALDMAENYPAMLADRLRYTPTGLLGRLVRRPGLARVVERAALRLVDHVVVVVEESRERLLDAGVAPGRLSVVGNTPRVERWSPGDTAGGAGGAGVAGVAMVYLGNLDGSRGIDVAIRAVHRLKAADHPVSLTVIGDGPSIGSLRFLAGELGVTDRVRITGRLSFEDVRTELARANVGLIPHYSTEAWNSTMPNKLFDYMMLGLAVIVSDARPAARVVRETGCGEVFRDRDVEDLARCIAGLARPELRANRGGHGAAAVRARYNWAHDSRVLVEALEAVARPPAVALGA